MKKLELYYPAKPFIQSQGWGIKNPSYLQFGFDAHNGTDFILGEDSLVYAPVEFEVEDVGYNDGAGNYVRGITTKKYEVDGVECYVGMMFMHFERTFVKKGQNLVVGDQLGIADNTGFSTGPHTHLSLYRLKKRVNITSNRLDKDWHTNYTFDPQPYWTGKYAKDMKSQPKPVKPPVFAFNRDLQVGMEGEDVRALQKYLNSKGHYVSLSGVGSPGKETTYFGDLTAKALVSFQKAKKISPAIGYFGPKTRSFINKNP